MELPELPTNLSNITRYNKDKFIKAYTKYVDFMKQNKRHPRSQSRNHPSDRNEKLLYTWLVKWRQKIKTKHCIRDPDVYQKIITLLAMKKQSALF